MRSGGFSIIELMASIAIAGMLFATLQQLMSASADLKQYTASENQGIQQVEFAMQRMLRHARYSERLLLPSVDRSSTPVVESIRDEVVGVDGVSAVLAVSLPPAIDRDADGVPDADNDGDGRLDEDTSGDMTNDGKAGIVGIDDDADQLIDEGLFSTNNDDEFLFIPDEDRRDGADSDGDGTIDEDWGADNNGDGQPGTSGVDDDDDGQIDEGNRNDDDEDGSVDEDWIDPVVYFLDGDRLIERSPLPWDVNGDTAIDGNDYVERNILSGVSRFRVERVALPELAYPLVDLTLEAEASNGRIFSLQTRVRIGSAR